MRYKATKDVEVESAGRGGAVVGPISFDKGYYETSDEDEITVLDACATDPDNPIGFDPKEA